MTLVSNETGKHNNRITKTTKETDKFNADFLEFDLENKQVVTLLYLIVLFLYASAATGEFARAMVCLYLAEIPMARPNEPDMPPKRTKKVD